MKRRDFVSMCASSALVSGAVPRTVLAQDKVCGKRRTCIRSVIRQSRRSSAWQKLEKETNGRISIQMYPSMQLGGEKEMIEQAQVGALQIARISVGAMGPVVDELNVFNLPFIFRDEAHMRKVIDGPIGQGLLEKITASPQSRLVVLGWMDAGTRNVYSNKPVTKPEDLKGRRSA